MAVSGAWTYTLSGTDATITDYDTGIGGFTPTIPTTLDGNDVVAIDTSAMASKGLTTLALDHVVSLGDNAFRSNTGIEVTLNADVTVGSSSYSPFDSCAIANGLTITSNVTSIPQGLFSNAGLTAITIPSSVTSIGNSAFSGNSLTAITIPSSVTSIGNSAFFNNSIATLALDYVVSLGDNVFRSNTGIEVTLNADVTVGSSAYSPFDSCAIANGLTITSNVTSIPRGLFSDAGLTAVTIPSSVTSIGDSAFRSNNTLTSFYCYNKNVTFGSGVLTNSQPSPKGTIYGYANSTTEDLATTFSTYYDFSTALLLVTTLPATNVLSNSATLNGFFIESQNTVTEIGFVYSKSPNPTTADTKNVISTAFGNQSDNVVGLDSNSTYYYRAFESDEVIALGETDDYDASSVSGSSDLIWINQAITAEKDFTLKSVNFKPRITGTHTLSFRDASNNELANSSVNISTVNVLTEFELNTTVDLTNGTDYNIYVTHPTTSIYRDSLLYSGSLWSSNGITVNIYGYFARTGGFGLIEADETTTTTYYGDDESFSTIAGGISSPSTFTITPNIFILDYIQDATATASTDTVTVILGDGVEMAEDDFVVNTTRTNTSRRIENEPDAGIYQLNATITDQAQDDTIRQYVFTDHTDLIKQETIYFNYRNSGESELSFDMETSLAYIPRAGQYIRLYFNDFLYFTGKIINVHRRLHQNGITEKVLCSVRCASLNVIPPRRTIQVDFETGTTASVIVNQMIDDYLNDEGIEAGQIDDGIQLEEYWLDDMISIGDVLDQIADKSGYQWNIDKNFALNFYQNPTTVSTCTYSISDSTSSTFTDFRNVTVEETVENYNNKVFFAGGQDQNGNLVLISQQDTTSILEMQDYSAGSGVYGVVDRNSQVQEASYEIAESGTSETAVVIGTVSMITGDMIYNVTKGYKANIIAVDGSTYTLDTAISNQTVDDTIIVYDMANNIARNTLERQKEIPKIITFDTFHLGFNPGEKLNVELSTLSVSSGDYVIDEVNISHIATDYFNSTVKAILRNSTDFNTQRNPDLRQYFKNLGASAKSRTGYGVQRGATNPRVTTSDTTPSTPKAGDVFINTTASPSTLYYYDGTAWTT